MQFRMKGRFRQACLWAVPAKRIRRAFAEPLSTSDDETAELPEPELHGDSGHRRCQGIGRKKTAPNMIKAAVPGILHRALAKKFLADEV